MFTDLAGIPSGSLTDTAITNGALSNATVALAPGEEAKITLRIVDPDKANNLTLTIGGRSVSIDPALVSFDQANNPIFDIVLPVITSQAVNSSDFMAGVTQPPVAIPLQILTTSFPDEVLFDAAGGGLAASGGWGTYRWTVASGSLPPGMSLTTGGGFTGTPTALGTYTFTVQVPATANNDFVRRASRLKRRPAR